MRSSGQSKESRRGKGRRGELEKSSENPQEENPHFLLFEPVLPDDRKKSHVERSTLAREYRDREK